MILEALPGVARVEPAQADDAVPVDGDDRLVLVDVLRDARIHGLRLGPGQAAVLRSREENPLAPGLRVRPRHVDPVLEVLRRGVGRERREPAELLADLVVEVVPRRRDLPRLAEGHAAVGREDDPRIGRRLAGRLDLVGQELEVPVGHHERAVRQDHRHDVVDPDLAAAVGGLDRADPGLAVVLGAEDADRVHRVRPVENAHVDAAGELSGRLVHRHLLVVVGVAELVPLAPGQAAVGGAVGVKKAARPPLVVLLEGKVREDGRAEGSENDVRIGAAVLHLLGKFGGLPGRAPVHRRVRAVGGSAGRLRVGDGAADHVLGVLRIGRENQLDVGEVPVARDERVRAHDDLRARRRLRRAGGRDPESRREGSGQAQSSHFFSSFFATKPVTSAPMKKSVFTGDSAWNLHTTASETPPGSRAVRPPRTFP